MRQYAGFGTAAESNRRYRYLLERGTTGLSVAFDLPTQIGYDSDDPHAAGRGRARRRRHRQPGGHGGPARRHPARARLHVDDHQRHRGHPAGALRRGGAPARHRRGRRSRARCRTTSSRSTWRAGPTSTRPRRRCGWSPTSSPTAPSTCRSGTRSRSPATTSARRGPRRRRRSPSRSRTRSSTCAPRSAAGLDARALRRAALVLLRLPLRLRRGGGEVPRRAAAVGAADEGDASASTNPKAQHLRFHVQTGGVTLTAQQPDNNVVRVALQALAAVLGGCQSLHTNAQGRGAGAAHARPRRGWRCARSRSSRTSPASPTPSIRWAASYAVEAATDAVEREARALLDAIEARGGALRGDRARRHPARDPGVGLPAPAGGGVGRARDRRREPLRGGRRAARRGDILRIDPELERAQVERVRALRARRDAAAPGGRAGRAGATRARGREQPGAGAWSTPCWPGPRWARSRAGCAQVFGEHRETLVV